MNTISIRLNLNELSAKEVVAVYRLVEKHLAPCEEKDRLLEVIDGATGQVKKYRMWFWYGDDKEDSTFYAYNLDDATEQAKAWVANYNRTEGTRPCILTSVELA